MSEGSVLELALSGVAKAHRLRIRRDSAPTEMTLDGRTLATGTDWTYSASDRRLVIVSRRPVGGVYRIR